MARGTAVCLRARLHQQWRDLSCRSRRRVVVPPNVPPHFFTFPAVCPRHEPRHSHRAEHNDRRDYSDYRDQLTRPSHGATLRRRNFLRFISSARSNATMKNTITPTTITSTSFSQLGITAILPVRSSRNPVSNGLARIHKLIDALDISLVTAPVTNVWFAVDWRSVQRLRVVFGRRLPENESALNFHSGRPRQPSPELPNAVGTLWSDSVTCQPYFGNAG